ncbi:hypothetical protein M3592_25845 [Priestia aryabhattai]|uniref:hypothetical protein n=1 Tax=Priestia aryabhattai TaxID=412384 RepID=UPI002040EA98|nr:hypothetical protein [Priestia aryabhattai]MCM2978867.1 hypothetical protein [Priestia aryabhattai]
MALFKGDAIKRVNNLLDKGEKRRAKLEEKVAKLQEEQNAMQQAVMDDFNESILEDKEPNKRLTNDLNKVREELQSVQFLLSQIDAVIKSELEKSKKDIERERNEFQHAKREEFQQIFDELNQVKIAYLEKLIEYRKKNSAYADEHFRTFRDISNRLGLRTDDPREHYKLSINMRYQRDEYYSPILTPDEHRDAFIDNKLSYLTAKNKDKFKQ